MASSYPLSRFLVFAYDDYYPDGINLIGSRPTIEEAQAFAVGLTEDLDHAEILDSETGETWLRTRDKRRQYVWRAESYFELL